MLNANVRKNYTASGNIQAETLIDSVLSEMADALQSTGLSVYLGGSYGRGEGGVRQDTENGVLYNDLDFFVFAKKADRSAEKLLHDIAEKYEKQLGVDVDFSKVTSVKEIKRNAKRLMMQELKRGYHQVCGEDLLAEYLPEIPAEKLPFSEACRLLLNRGMGLLFAQNKIAENSEDYDFILRNIYKAVLGSCDAKLIAEGKYCWSIFGRLEEIQKSDLPEKWKKLYSDAVQFKSSPHRNMPENIKELVQEVRALFQACVLAVSGAEDAKDIKTNISNKCKISGESSLLNYVKYCIKTRKIHRDINFLKIPHAAVTLCKLCEKNAYDEELYNDWLKFN